MLLKHLFFPGNYPLGFAVCVFADEDGATFVPVADRNEVIVGFASTSGLGLALHDAPIKENGQPYSVVTGDALLHAFWREDGTPVVGVRSVVTEAVASCIENFRGEPFIMLEMASFIRDKSLLREATIECNKLLGLSVDHAL